MELSELSIAAIRSLGIDMINKANSGHPGMVIGSAPALYTLFNEEMNYYYKDPSWFNRDRFVLASGHASALLYVLLHLSKFNITMEDLKEFRQLNSITPGHPECDITTGVDASSGPLGQGIPMAVGMAIAERFLATKYNKEGYDLVDHYTYVLCGDGDMQEGVTYEATSLAGHLCLGKLICLYDANKVTLDGPLTMSFTEDVKKRYEAIGWQVIEVANGNDTLSINKAIKKAKREKCRPSLIIVNTIIGQGSKNQGTSKTHGSPLGTEDGKNAKLSYGYNEDEFVVVDEVYEDFKAKTIKRGRNKYNKWHRLCKEYKKDNPKLYDEFMAVINGEQEIDFDVLFDKYSNDHNDATRNTSNEIINEIAKQSPTFMSGTADLASSVKTEIIGEKRFSAEDYSGRNIAFGIREFAMVSIMNGVTLHKGIKISGGEFMVFSDYFKPALRMACLMKQPIILPLSHDSIAVGEDGPTHQPVDQLPMLRSIPNIRVYRPADATETVAAWKKAFESKTHPSVILLTRQNVPNNEFSCVEGFNKGAYIISKENERIDAIIIATGSEVSLSIEAQKELLKDDIDIRVISMPSFELFEEQDNAYKEEILPSNVENRLSVEMASSFGWHKYVGLKGATMSVDHFGKSAPANDVIKDYGFTVEDVVNNVKELINKNI